MECEIFAFNTLGDYRFADVVAFYRGQWLLSRHRERTTWETQGGHIEAGETPLEAARRELYEESGAVDFDLEPLCDYWLRGELKGVPLEGNSQVYIAQIRALGAIPPGSEMETVRLFGTLPPNLTYEALTQKMLPLILERRPK